MEQLVFEFDVEDKSTKKLGKVQTAWNRFFGKLSVNAKKTGSTIGNAISAPFKGFFANYKKANEAAKKHFNIMRMGGKVLDKLKEKAQGVKTSLANFGKGLLSKWAAIIGGASIVGAITTMVNEFVQFTNTIADLNTVMNINQKLLQTGGSIIEGLGRTLSYSSEEMATLVKQGLGLRAMGENAYNAGKRLKFWADQSTYLAKSTGMALTTVGEMNSQLVQVFGLNPRAIRNIGAAFKYVTDATAIGADELAQYMKNLTPIFARLDHLSGGAKKRLTADLVGIAGAIGQVFGDPQKISSMFAKMLDPLDAQGQQMITFVAQLSGKSTNAIAKSLKSGDMVSVFKDFTVGLNKITDPDQLNMFSKIAGDVFGMDFVDFTKLRKLGKDQGVYVTNLIAQTRKHAKEAKLHEKAARKTQSQVTTAMNKIKDAMRKVWIIMGKGFTNLGDGPLDMISNKLVSLAEWARREAKPGGAIWNFFSYLSKASSWAFSQFKKAAEWIIETGALQKAFKSISTAVTWAIDSVKSLIGWWDSLSDTTKSVVKKIALGVGALIALGPALAGLGTIMGAMSAPILAAAAGIVAMYVGAKKLANWVDNKQTQDIKRRTMAKGTTTEISSALSQKNSNRRIGAIRGMLSTSKTAGVLTKEGKINEKELSKRAMNMFPGTSTEAAINRSKLFNQWRDGLSQLVGANAGKDVEQAIIRRNRDIKAAQNEQILDRVPSNTPTPLTKTASSTTVLPAPVTVMGGSDAQTASALQAQTNVLVEIKNALVRSPRHPNPGSRITRQSTGG